MPTHTLRVVRPDGLQNDRQNRNMVTKGMNPRTLWAARLILEHGATIKHLSRSVRVHTHHQDIYLSPAKFFTMLALLPTLRKEPDYNA